MPRSTSPCQAESANLQLHPANNTINPSHKQQQSPPLFIPYTTTSTYTITQLKPIHTFSMDYLKNLSGGNNNNEGSSNQNTQQNTQQSQGQGQGQQQQEGGGFLSGIGNKLNSAAGGGPESEKNEDMLDKGIDMFQEKVLGQGAQNNESAVEQAKDEQISDFLRGQYKGATGSDIPIKDKETRLG
ncbi:hypothetical protein PVAG01_09497 [Phlyctema vagabunda]|uniref:Uncharacterized protein n=1 Tax=Phlyctema vagabunda TaxID=108571 RepID=A0ABR4P7J3_9HELO